MENPVNIQETSTSTTTTVKPVQPKKKIPIQIIAGVVFLFLLIVGGGVAYYLSTQQQDIRQQASGGPTYTTPDSSGNCPSGYTGVYNGSTFTCYKPADSETTTGTGKEADCGTTGKAACVDNITLTGSVTGASGGYIDDKSCGGRDQITGALQPICSAQKIAANHNLISSCDPGYTQSGGICVGGTPSTVNPKPDGSCSTGYESAYVGSSLGCKLIGTQTGGTPLVTIAKVDGQCPSGSTVNVANSNACNVIPGYVVGKVNGKCGAGTSAAGSGLLNDFCTVSATGTTVGPVNTKGQPNLDLTCGHDRQPACSGVNGSNSYIPPGSTGVTAAAGLHCAGGFFEKDGICYQPSEIVDINAGSCGTEGHALCAGSTTCKTGGGKVGPDLKCSSDTWVSIGTGTGGECSGGTTGVYFGSTMVCAAKANATNLSPELGTGKCPTGTILQTNANGTVTSCKVTNTTPLTADQLKTFTNYQLGTIADTNSSAYGNLPAVANTDSSTACVGTVCTAPAGGCIATHTCGSLDSAGHCTVQYPTVAHSGSVDAQSIANSSCQCVQVDVLSGGQHTCDATEGHEGHFQNGDASTLVDHRQVCPNVSCNIPATSTPPATNPPSSNPPSSSPTPGVTPSPAVCMNVTISKPNPQVGDSVTFTCGSVTGVNHYQFRVKLPDGSFQSVAASSANSNVSAAFTIATAGSHNAQCRLCTGAADSTCQAYGSL